MPVTLEQLLSPLQFLDLASLYDRGYSAAIDFTLTFFLFLGVAQATLAKKFPGRPGKRPSASPSHYSSASASGFPSAK